MVKLFTVLIFAIFFTNIIIAQSTQGLVAYYPFNGNANDYSGNGNNPTAIYGVTYVAGQLDTAAKFTSMSYLNVPDNNSFDFSNATGVTLATWIRQEQNTTGIILLKIGEGGYLDDEYSLQINANGSLSGSFNGPEYQQKTIITNTTLNLNTWNHIVFIWNKADSKVTFYINGVFDTTTTSNITSIQNTSTPIRIGKPLISYLNSFTGSIDDTRIYNRALSETEILELYHEGGWSGRELNTIIITNGFTGEGLIPINPIVETKWKHLRWQFAMADAVSDNRDIYLIRKGNVYPIEATFSQFAAIYSNSTIDYLIDNYVVSRAINPDKDNVFIFDWTLESAINVHGFAEAAGDVLAATLVNLANDYSFLLKHLHFIGHSRGCVVNSEAIQRLIYWAANGILPSEVNLDPEIHMTTLDPHPAGHWRGFLVPMDDDRVNSFNIGVAGWKSGSYLTKYIDNYFETHFHLWQNPFKGLDYFPGLNTTSPSKTDLTTKLPIDDAHGLVHTWYFGTINTIANEDEFGEGPNIPRTEWYNSNLGTTEGFFRSRNRLGNLSDIYSLTENLKDVTEDTKLSNTSSIFNGNFSKSFYSKEPGWSYQGGETPQVTLIGGNISAILTKSSPVLIHNFLYFPDDVEYIWFRTRTIFPTSDVIVKVYISDQFITSFQLNSPDLNFVWKKFAIPSALKGRTNTIKFELENSVPLSTQVLLDDIGFYAMREIISSVACPVDFHIYDNLGNHTGPINDSTYVEEIPGSQYYVYEDSTGEKIKTVYLEPLDGTNEYTFVIESQDTTSYFSYVIEDYSDTSRGTITFEYDSIAIEPNTVATCTLNTNVQTPTLEVDIDGDGTPDTTYAPNVITGIEDDQRNNNIISIPKEYSLSQNFPNPFNPSTKISWQSPVSGQQTLKVYDVLGNEIATLVNEYRNAGKYEIEFDGKNLASGIYFYQIKAGEFIDTKKMLLLK
ncbi:MAG: LamG-like jellyroll fold domain-containing protein [Ignavibacterium sp.]|jgi:hypothetical protein|nr:LamG-like jellyroll fold domain-containing protein [Ignavibacterium sp.]